MPLNDPCIFLSLLDNGSVKTLPLQRIHDTIEGILDACFLSGLCRIKGEYAKVLSITSLFKIRKVC
jgi:hypothetical protein